MIKRKTNASNLIKEFVGTKKVKKIEIQIETPLDLSKEIFSKEKSTGKLSTQDSPKQNPSNSDLINSLNFLNELASDPLKLFLCNKQVICSEKKNQKFPKKQQLRISKRTSKNKL